MKPATPVDGAPDPSAELVATCAAILAGPMRDVPILNPRLAVEAVGFQRLGPAWFGVLVTPWFINLVLVPDAAPAVPAGSAVAFDLPCGRLEFLHARLGARSVLACSLLSPVPPDFDAAAARAGALAALDAVLVPPAPPLPAARAPLSRRELLFGRGAGA